MSRVLVTGHNGYIGTILTELLSEAGHQVVGLDNFMFAGCAFGAPVPRVEAIRKDIREVNQADLEGFDAICHLAGISNDPVGDLNPEVTYEINHRASVRLAEMAKEAGVERFIFSSSCSIYGASPGGWVDESSPISPVTPYGWSKIKVEEDVSSMAGDDFSPVFLRNSTAYGMSPKLRADLVLNNMVGYAVTQGRVFMRSDGSPWRPMIHIEDISRAFVASVEAPREKVHGEVFNVGATGENYRMREVADIVESVVPGSTFEMSSSGGPDKRDYRVNCDKIAEALPAFNCKWDVRSGAAELYKAFVEHDLSDEVFFDQLVRIKHIKRQLAAGRLSDDLRVIEPAKN